MIDVQLVAILSRGPLKHITVSASRVQPAIRDQQGLGVSLKGTSTLGSEQLGTETSNHRSIHHLGGHSPFCDVTSEKILKRLTTNHYLVVQLNQMVSKPQGDDVQGV